MCGIVGCNGAIENINLMPALDRIAHRGPDDSGVYESLKDGVRLGHRRLSIIDLSTAGRQPMADPSGQVVLTYNGEIYNYKELRRDLERRGYRFRGHSDTEVLLALYMLEGEELLGRLNGIFAFAIWDNRKRTLFLARDALGVKPLYWATVKGAFLFSSEIKSLIELEPTLSELDVEAIDRYLTFLWCPGSGTPLKSVRKLEPGNAIIVREGTVVRCWQWYNLPTGRAQQTLDSGSSAIEGVLEHLRDAVNRQMVADVPVGAFLSGGLDSSAIVSLAAQDHPDLRCFTIDVKGGQDDGHVDDLPYARKVARKLGVRLDVVTVGAGQFAQDLERMIIQLDEPLADPAPLNVLYISELARREGITVLLSGAGGDDLFTGYRRHRALRFDNLWGWAPLEIRRLLSGIAPLMDSRKSWTRRVSKILSGIELEGNDRLINYFRWAKEDLLRSLYTPEFKRQLGASRAAEPLLEFLRNMPRDIDPLELMLALEQRFFLSDHNLLYTDKMSMAAGVEVRVPFLDLDLVKFAATIPVSYKQRYSTGKWVLKKAMEPYLPKDIIYRPKTGFGAPIRRWVRHDLRELVGDILSEQSLLNRGLFEPASVRRLIKDNEEGRVDGSYTILSLLCIELWCRSFT